MKCNTEDNCTICNPTKDDSNNGRDDLAGGDELYQAFLIDEMLIFNRNFGYPNKALLKAQINFCPNCGDKL